MNHKNSKPGSKLRLHTALVFAIAFLLSVVPVSASSESGPYLTLTGSIDMFDDSALTSKADSSLPPGNSIELETGLGFNHSIGYRFRNSFSAEVEFSYKSGQFGPGLDGDVNSKSFLVNGIYSFNIREFYTPFVGYGIGYAFHEASIKDKGNREDLNLAYQFKMGVDMELSRKLSLLVGYRYFTTNNPEFKGYFTAESSSHGIEAGIKFHF
ncbi:uncharacterized protein METZ01_LOCUS220875 [marine metagenome]|uniref:Outer membrane protein beta-barrel domain-containing protein n=1 Tax=marine metagenome TaxID=408172 RepID=A0A382G1E3_9ZZZZ